MNTKNKYILLVVSQCSQEYIFFYSACLLEPVCRFLKTFTYKYKTSLLC